MFQSKVNRQFTAGFVGEIIRDGTVRAKPGRITSPTIGANGSTNRIARVFGYDGVTGAPPSSIANPPVGMGRAADVYTVKVGGDLFFGILGHPKHYTTSGTSSGALSPTLDLPTGTEGEFVDSTAGIVVEVINMTEAVVNTTFGTKLAYISESTTAAQNPLSVPLGAIIAYTGELPEGLKAVPNAFTVTELSIPASAAGQLAAATVIVQMAN